jgi:protein SCO1
VLKKFSELHDVNFNDWSFLTGDKKIISSLMKEVGIVTIVGDSVKNSDESWTYFYIHTDRIQLIDQEGKIRKNYPGSKANIDEVVADIKSLE